MRAFSKVATLAAGKMGKRKRKGNEDSNVNHITKTPKRQSAPTGSGNKLATVNRLYKKRPDLHKRVVDGEMTAYAAAVEAGIHNRRVHVNMDKPQSAAATIRKHMDADKVSELIDLLQDDDQS